jgi:hypothetical protein
MVQELHAANPTSTKATNPSCIRRNIYAADKNLENTPSLLLSFGSSN